MEQKRQVLGEEEIKAVILTLKESGWQDANLLSLVRRDLEFGLTQEEIDLYLQAKFKPQQMRKLSLAIRKYGTAFATTIAKEELDEQCMQVAIDFYEKGITLEDIQSGIAQKTSAYALKQTYESMVSKLREAEQNATLQHTAVDKEYVEKLLVDMKEIVVSINRNAEKYEQMSEQLKEAELAKKDALIKQQQEELEILNQTITTLRAELANKNEEKEEMKDAAQRQVPIQYVATIQGTPSGRPITAVIEKSQPKRVGFYALIGKLAYKKKSKQDIIKLIASGELSTEQLVQIKSAMEKGLTEEQLLSLIHGNVTPEQMKEIIEIAVLENSAK